jgi:hypothetical protein
MPEEFFGPWSIRVLDSRIPQRQRIEIRGSDGSDGGHAAEPGSTLAVSGPSWTLAMAALHGGSWRPSALRRSAVAYTNADGLVVTVGGDDSPPGTLDRDYDDLIVVLQSEDPLLDPRPWTNPYDFTFPRRIVRIY